MSAVLPIPVKAADATVTNKDVSVFERKVSGIQKGILGINSQVKKVVDWSKDIRQIINDIGVLQEDFDKLYDKDSKVATENSLATTAKTINDSIDKLTEVLVNASDTSNSSSDIIKQFIEKEILKVTTQITNSLNITAWHNNEKTVAIIEKLDAMNVSIVQKLDILSNSISAEDILKAVCLNESLLHEIKNTLVLLVNAINDITDISTVDAQLDGECWYGRDSETGYLSNSSITGWYPSVDTVGKFGKPIQISDCGILPIKRILVSYANISNKVYKIRFYHGPTFEEAIILTEILFIKSGSSFGSSPIMVNAPKISPKDKVWCAITCEIAPANLGLLLSM